MPATDITSFVNSPIVSHGKNRTRRRTLVARMVPSAGSQTSAARKTTPPPHPEPVARSECDPPFIIDAAGIKRMKVSCL